LSSYKGLSLCTPTALPAGFYWPIGAEPSREYSLNGYPAVAAYATESSGNSILWMWTTWQAPPILDAPSQTITRAGTQYNLYYDSGHVRMVAWHIGKTLVWVTNTLLNDMTDQQMIALATSCQT